MIALAVVEPLAFPGIESSSAPGPLTDVMPRACALDVRKRSRIPLRARARARSAPPILASEETLEGVVDFHMQTQERQVMGFNELHSLAMVSVVDWPVLIVLLQPCFVSPGVASDPHPSRDIIPPETSDTAWHRDLDVHCTYITY